MKSSVVLSKSPLNISQNQLFYGVHLVTYAQIESSFVPTGDSPIIYSVNYFQTKQKYLLSAEGVST